MSLYATRVAVRDDVRARFAGVPFPGTAAQQCTFLGTGLSAPLALLVGWCAVLAADNRIALRTLAAATFLGSLGEPVTWQHRYPAIIGASVAIPAAVVLLTRPTTTPARTPSLGPRAR